MHDIRFIREHPDDFDRALNRRILGNDEKKRFSSQNVLSIDERRRAIIRTLESWQARRNEASKLIGAAKKSNEEETAQALMAEVAECKNSISNLEREQKDVDEELNRLLAQIPNLPLDAPGVPDGKSADDNVEHHRFGAKRDYAFKPKQHFELGEALGQMDFETAAKLSGARFVVLKKGLARLERALGQFFLDVHTSEPHNYTEVSPPLLVRDEVMFGTAQLPKFADDQFQTTHTIDPKDINRRLFETYESLRPYFAGEVELPAEEKTKFAKILPAIQKLYDEVIVPHFKNLESRKRENLWLIPTAEVPLTNLVRESIVDEAQLPMRLTACTPCFRAEAGAAGKDTRGMIRQHQFTKVELVSITTPEQSKDEHERMLSCAEEILRRLDLHYRVMTLCTGDMGFAAQKTYDIEVWLPGQNMYREISSCSVCGEFQARRMNARSRAKDRTIRYLHTLNGSGVAVGRALIAVMETYQQADGSIAIPEALQPYMGGLKKIEK
jgi:seryl-tRNA synthetase